MREQKYIQFAFVAGETPEILSERLNRKVYELRGKSPSVEVDLERLTAQIKYTESDTIPESIGEEYSMRGVRLTCKMCPYFIPTTKTDGSEDGRAKWGMCPMSPNKRTTKEAPGCDVLFESINSGVIKLTL